MHQGKAFIFSAPSGSGKTTIVKHLLSNNPRLSFSISATTRPRRESYEVDGKDYYFLTVEEFHQKIENNQFIEWEQVYHEKYYGTLKSEMERIWTLGQVPVFDVDVQGGVNLKEYFQDRALAVFIKVPSLEILEERLKGRKTETEKSLAARLEKAKFEMSFEDKFDLTLINQDLERSFSEAQDLVDDFLKE